MPKSTTIKAWLYIVPLYLTPFAEKLCNVLFENCWPSWQQVVGCSILGVISACIGARAFYDGSYERSLNK
jgi:hypothetical protein